MEPDDEELSSVRRTGAGLVSRNGPASLVAHDDENNWELRTQQIPQLSSGPISLPKFIHPPPPPGVPAAPPSEIRIFPSLIASPKPPPTKPPTYDAAAIAKLAAKSASPKPSNPAAPPLVAPAPPPAPPAPSPPPVADTSPRAAVTKPPASATPPSHPPQPPSPKGSTPGAGPGLPFYIQTVEEAQQARARDLAEMRTSPAPLPSTSSPQPLNLMVPTAAMPKRNLMSAPMAVPGAMPVPSAPPLSPPVQRLSSPVALPLSAPAPVPAPPPLVPVVHPAPPLMVPMSPLPGGHVGRACGGCQGSGWFHSRPQHACLRPHFCPACVPCGPCGGTGLLLVAAPARPSTGPQRGCGVCLGRGRIHIQPHQQCAVVPDCRGCAICGPCGGRGVVG